MPIDILKTDTSDILSLIVQQMISTKASVRNFSLPEDLISFFEEWLNQGILLANDLKIQVSQTNLSQSESFKFAVIELLNQMLELQKLSSSDYDESLLLIELEKQYEIFRSINHFVEKQIVGYWRTYEIYRVAIKRTKDRVDAFYFPPLEIASNEPTATSAEESFEEIEEPIAVTKPVSKRKPTTTKSKKASLKKGTSQKAKPKKAAAKMVRKKPAHKKEALKKLKPPKKATAKMVRKKPAHKKEALKKLRPPKKAAAKMIRKKPAPKKEALKKLKPPKKAAAKMIRKKPAPKKGATKKSTATKAPAWSAPEDSTSKKSLRKIPKTTAVSKKGSSKKPLTGNSLTRLAASDSKILQPVLIRKGDGKRYGSEVGGSYLRSKKFSTARRSSSHESNAPTTPFSKSKLAKPITKSRLTQEPQERFVSTWLEKGTLPLTKLLLHSIGLTIGSPVTNAFQVIRFTEPNFRKQSAIKLLIRMHSSQADIAPAWQYAMLPATGEMKPVYFDVIPKTNKNLELTITIYNANNLSVLEELKSSLPCNGKTSKLVGAER